MRGPLLGLLLTLVVPALVAWGVWAARRRGADPERAADPGNGIGRAELARALSEPAAVGAPPGRGLRADLERWVAAGLVSAEQAEAIAAHERVSAPRRPTTERRGSLVAEALGYVGASLAIAGAAVGLGQAWDGVPTAGRLAIAFGAAAALLIGGAVLLAQTEPPFRRLQSVLWALAVGAVAWALFVLVVDFSDVRGEWAVLAVGGGAATAAGILYAVRRHPLQQAVFYAALHAALIGALLCLPGDLRAWMPALGVWALGVAWALLGWFRVLEPWWLALALGSVGAVIGPAVGLDRYPWLLAVALVTSVFFMAVSVPSGQVPLLAVGTIGTFAYLTWAVIRYFSDNLGVPLALVIVGAVFLILAVVAGRLTRVSRRRRRPWGAGR